MTLTAINFVHVNGRSLYSVDWCMVVVEGGNVLHHVKSVGELSGGGENCSGGDCPGDMSRSRTYIQQQQAFNGRSYGTTQVSRHQNSQKH